MVSVFSGLRYLLYQDDAKYCAYLCPYAPDHKWENTYCYMCGENLIKLNNAIMEKKKAGMCAFFRVKEGSP
jgi:hypothetical protein